jgi:hypothetical protein|nr:MAG TPA: major capsid protein [Caudoviricetes sp.]
MSSNLNLIKGIFAGIAANTDITKQTDRDSMLGVAFNVESISDNEKINGNIKLKEYQAQVESMLAGLETSDYLSTLSTESAEGSSAMALTPVQKRAAEVAGLIAISPKMYKSGIQKAAMQASQTLGGSIVANCEDYSSDIVDALTVADSISTESFSGQALTSVYYATVALAVAGSRQDDFTDALFPLIVMNPTDAYYEIKISIDNYMTETRHTSPYAIDNAFDKKSVLRNIFNNDLLSANRLEIHPVLDNDVNNDILIKEAKRGITVSDETYETAPYRVDKKINLFAMCNTKGEIARGSINDYTDTIDRALNLRALYIEFQNAGGDKLQYKIDTTYLPRTIFNVQPEGYGRELRLDFRGEFVLSTKKSIDFQDKSHGDNFLFGATLGAGDEHAVTLKSTVTGTVITNEGAVQVTATKLTVDKIVNLVTNVEVKDLTTGVGKDIVDAVNKMKIDGYDIDPKITNENFRRKGILVTSDDYKFRQNVHFRSGVSVAKPVESQMGNENDGTVITVDKQASILNDMMAANAVMTFVDFAERLHEARDNGGLPRFKTNTPADMYVSPWYSFEKIVVKELADSMRSTERRDDVSASILNKIKDAVALMSIDSMYDVVFKKLYRGMKKTVVIATDPYIASYISENLIQSNNGAVTQNRFPLTFDTDAIIVSTQNPLMKGKLMVTFSMFDDPKRNSEPNAMSFGWCLFTPPLNREIQYTMNGSTYQVLFAEPRYTFVPNLPIMLEFNITGVTEAMMKNVQHHKIVL